MKKILPIVAVIGCSALFVGCDHMMQTKQNENLINYYIIKSGEALETRANKLDSTISAIDSIISIIEANLTTSSNYYQTNLSSTYNNLVNQTTNIRPVEEINESSSNQEIAGKIACVLDFCNLNKPTTNQENKISTNEPTTINRSRTIQNNTQNNQQTTLNTTQNQHIENNLETNTISQQPNTINQTTNNQEDLNKSTNPQNEQNSNQSSELSHNNRIRRLPNSVRQRRRFYQNNNNESSNLDFKNKESDNNQIKHLDRRNNLMQNTKTLRAERNSENLNNEEFTATASPLTEQRATRVPYTEPINTFEK